MADNNAKGVQNAGDASSSSLSSFSTTTSSYTFLNANASQSSNSQDVTDQALINNNDRFAHTRTKRKRTSPEDFAILESEYESNSKPDRKTRILIASRVSLSEKEIQVWFQNRRQMTRRKLNTWQPNEITSIIRSTQDATSPTVSPSASFQVDSNSNTVIEAESIEDKMEAKYTSQGTELASFHRDDSFASQQTLAPSSSATQDMQPQDSIIAQVSTPGNLKRTSSMVRLAMSLDGQASVILRGQTPSPPNKIVTGHVDGRVSIQRSESLITSSLLASTLDVPSAIPRVPGRSKDTRSWEFWCDSERREALTKSAEINQRGSAAGPISLLRSGSYGFNSYGNMVASLKKRKSEEDIGVDRRHKLSRTRSSNARLQFHEDDVDSLKGKKSGTTTIYRDGGDSDKENVDPDPIGDLWARRRILSPKGVDKKREVLEQNTSVPSQSASLGALVTKDNKKTPAKKVKSSAKEKNTPAKKSKRARKTVAANDKENVVVESEGAGIMKEGSADREEDDELDAVQNLLRLSRGDWK